MTSAPPQILVADDDPELRAALRRALQLDGFVVQTAEHGGQALEMAVDQPPDALVLDIMMPTLDGLEVCRRLRTFGDRMPILVLTARDQISDRVAGLDAGADDYLPKPFALEELTARLRALLRRVAPCDTETLRYGDLVIDTATREVRRDDRLISLTRTEFAIAELFIRNAGQVLTRELIIGRIWGYEMEPASNSLEVFIGYLRRKTEVGGAGRLLHTVRGVGYVLR
ncbi:MAG TPA: response regulator transcription factor [Mycobacteriales bacterium]|jgi:two-component system response regulator MprA|nr:response regulator transcription factor [Mycobacteriales bacterium]